MIELLVAVVLYPLNMTEESFTKHAIEFYSEKYHVPYDDAWRMAHCESRFQNVRSQFWRTEDSFGPYQLQSEFYSRNAKRRGMYENPILRTSVEANVNMAIWVASQDGWSAWRNCAIKENLLGKKYNQELVLK